MDTARTYITTQSSYLVTLWTFAGLTFAIFVTFIIQLCCYNCCAVKYPSCYVGNAVGRWPSAATLPPLSRAQSTSLCFSAYSSLASPSHPSSSHLTCWPISMTLLAISMELSTISLMALPLATALPGLVRITSTKTLRIYRSIFLMLCRPSTTSSRANSTLN